MTELINIKKMNTEMEFIQTSITPMEYISTLLKFYENKGLSQIFNNKYNNVLDEWCYKMKSEVVFGKMIDWNKFYEKYEPEMKELIDFFKSELPNYNF